MDTSSSIFAAGRVLNGLYEIVGLMERCNNVRIYAAREIGSSNFRTLKVLHLQPSAADIPLIAAQQNEARNLARLFHPNILRALDYVVAESGEPYIVSEYFAGKTLKKLIAENNGIPYERALHIFAQICDGLQYAHNRGIILRGLSPSSICLADSQDGSVLVKLTDFSAAVDCQDESESESLSATQEGPCYMSPELLRGGPVDIRTDIFSIGCVIFETLIGTAPFTINEIKFALEEQVFLSPARFSVLRPDLDLPQDLEKVVRCALERDPRDRFENAEKLKNAILFMPGRQSVAKLDSIFDLIRSLFLRETKKGD